jgi:hypothetical protein
MRVKCNDCGFQGEIQERRNNKRTICPKCGLFGLEYDKKTERIISGRKRVKELVIQGTTKREIKLMLEGQLSPISIDEYYNQARRELELPKLSSGAPLDNKNAGNRKRGETRHCLDCEREIYITRYRIEHAKNDNVGKRCRPCALKWNFANRRQNPHRLTIPAIKRYIIWINGTFNKGKPKEIEYGITLACTLMANFIESKGQNKIDEQ